MKSGLAEIIPSTSQFQVAHVHNPFRRRVDQFDTMEWRPGLTVADVLRKYGFEENAVLQPRQNSDPSIVDMSPSPESGQWEVVTSESKQLDTCTRKSSIRVTVSVNGEIIPTGQWGRRYVMPGDQLIIAPEITGGGGGKSVLRTVLQVVVAIVAAYVGGPIGAIILIAGSLLIAALLPGDNSQSDQSLESATYTWNPSNTASQGVVIPRWYGTHRVYGNVISSYIDREDDNEYLNGLVAVGYGPVSAFGTFRINQQKSTFFDDVTIETRYGHINQSVFSNFTSTKTEYTMDVQITYNDPYIYTTVGDDFDGFEVDITFPGGIIAYDSEEGAYVETSVEILIQFRKQGDSEWITSVSETITEKQTTAVRKTYKQAITSLGIYEIQITRLTEDHIGSTTITDDSYLTTVREYYIDQFTYPRQAMYAFRALATSQLSNSFEISVMLDGLIINVYDGSNWSLQFSNNPAWVAWDILTQPVLGGTGISGDPYYIIRYDGLDPSRLDLPKFYEWAEYCDELVSDGLAGTEKRITFNGGFDSNITMWEALLQVCQIGRAVPVWQGVKLTIAVDKPADPVFLFTVGNIEESSFKETFLSQEERATEVEINYTNQDNDYERDKLVVYRTDVPYSQYKATIDLFGAVKQTEAWRAGKFRLNCNRYLLRTIELSVDIEALAATIGDVGYIQHDVPNWCWGGRIVSSTLYSATIDRKVTIEDEKTYKLLIRLDDDNLMERVISNSAGETDTITVTTPLNIRYDSEAGWYSSNYTYRQKVTIKHDKVAGSLQNFPFAIQITNEDNPIFDHALANGYDILVTSDDGETKIPHERSVWDTTNHILVLYVQIPALSPTVDGEIYIYYGYASCSTDQQNKTGVWDSNFLGVWHLEENPAGDYAYDSTVNGLTLNLDTTYGSDRLVASPIGYGWNFNGAGKLLAYTDTWGALSEFTAEGVVKCTDTVKTHESGWFGTKNEDLEIICGVNSGGDPWWSYTENGICNRVGITPGDYGISTPITSFEVDEWNYIAYSALESTYHKTYVNGAIETIDGITESVFAKISGGAWHLSIGQGWTWFVGPIGEIRFSKVERSAAWIQTTANNLMDNDATWNISDEEPLEVVAASVKKYDIWMLGESTEISNLYRIIGIKKTHDQKCTLTLINYDENVYADDANTPAFGVSTQSALEDMQPTSVILTESVTESSSGTLLASINITFNKSTDEDYRGCQIWYKLASSTTSGSWRQHTYTTGDSATIVGAVLGETYSVALLPVNNDGDVLSIYRAPVYEITISGADSEDWSMWVLDENGDWAFNG